MGLVGSSVTEGNSGLRAPAQRAAVTVGYQLLGDHLQGRGDLGI